MEEEVATMEEEIAKKKDTMAKAKQELVQAKEQVAKLAEQQRKEAVADAEASGTGERTTSPQELAMELRASLAARRISPFRSFQRWTGGSLTISSCSISACRACLHSADWRANPGGA